MIVAINQPYFYPSQLYFELMKSVDTFVFLNDVQYIQRGWVNRNRIKSYDKTWRYITVPIKKCSQKTNINEVQIDCKSDWGNTMLKTLRNTYGHKIVDHSIYCQLECNILTYDKLCPLLCATLKQAANYFYTRPCFIHSEELNIKNKTGQDRILAICKELGAKTYINLPGGSNLYDKTAFAKENIELVFLENTYNSLSILDYCFR